MSQILTGVIARAWNWLRAGPAERSLRRAYGMPAAYPERVAGSDAAALKGDFPAWAAELAADGLEAGKIILDLRREQGQ